MFNVGIAFNENVQNDYRLFLKKANALLSEEQVKCIQENFKVLPEAVTAMILAQAYRKLEAHPPSQQKELMEIFCKTINSYGEPQKDYLVYEEYFRNRQQECLAHVEKNEKKANSTWMNGSTIQNRLRKRLAEKKTKEKVGEIDKKLTLYTNDILSNLHHILLDGIKCIRESVEYKKTEEDIEKHIGILSEFTKTKKNRRRKKRNTQNKQFHPKSKKKPASATRTQKEITFPVRTYDAIDVRKVFYSNLLSKITHFRLHPRVARWQETDVTKIRLFSDHKNGDIQFGYEGLPEGKILKQRARHYLPGLEKLLNRPYRDIYSFITKRGYGLAAQLCFNDKCQNGIIYIGADQNNRIYHKYFEKVNFSEFGDHIFTENENELMEKEAPFSEIQEMEAEATYISENNGILHFRFSPHYEVKIYPIRDDLLAKELPPHDGIIKINY